MKLKKSSLTGIVLWRNNMTINLWDARFEIYQVADEAWVRKNFHKDIDLDRMELNDKWNIQLFGDKEK